jgi:hypothetical protein
MLLRLAAALAIASPAAAADFVPHIFFAGPSEGHGTLKIALRGSQSIHVRSFGRVETDGTLVLDQTIARGDEPPATRQWRIRTVAPGRYAGTLSDAAGPVAGETHGNRLLLRFRMKGGLDAEQWLTLSADGRSADNAMTVKKWGVVVARLRERIERR